MIPKQSAYPAIDRALGHLKEGVESGRWKGDYLPSLAVLAHETGVSRNTMWKAVRIAADQGLIVVIPGGRIFAGDRREGREDPALELWQSVQQTVTRDLLSGAFKHVPELPSPKELSLRYSVSYATMLKILRSMHQSGLVERTGRSYTPSSARRSRHPSTVVVLSTTLESNATSVVLERTKGIMDSVEKECARMGFRSRFVGLSPGEHDKNRRIIQALGNDGSITGFIYNLWLRESGPRRDRALDTIHALDRTGNPVAILDNVENYPQAPDTFLHENTRVFRVGSRRAGSALARHLIDLGHRSLAYISIYESTNWSRARLAGIREMADASGLRGMVAVHGRNFYEDFPMPEGTPFDQNLHRREFNADRIEQELRDLSRRYFERPRSGAIAESSGAREITVAMKELSTVRAILNKTAGANTRRSVLMTLADRVMDNIVNGYVNDLFAAIDQTGRSTAWIFSGDGTAFRALRYLAGSGRRVPEDISVAGFDNTMQAYEQKLTSVDFNMDAAVHQMLRFILAPNDRAFLGDSPVIEIEPSVIARESTGKPRLTYSK